MTFHTKFTEDRCSIHDKCPQHSYVVKCKFHVSAFLFNTVLTLR